MTTNNLVPCNTCGQLIDKNVKVCPYCGLPQKVKQRQSRATLSEISPVVKKPKFTKPSFSTPNPNLMPPKKKGKVLAVKILFIISILLSLCLFSAIISVAKENAWNKSHPVEATVKALDQAATQTERSITDGIGCTTAKITEMQWISGTVEYEVSIKNGCSKKILSTKILTTCYDEAGKKLGVDVEYGESILPNEVDNEDGFVKTKVKPARCIPVVEDVNWFP